VVGWMGGGKEWETGGCAWSIGKGRGAGGRARTQLASVWWDVEHEEPWEEEADAGPVRHLEDRDTLVVTLLSDLLARDARGEFVAGPGTITGALNRALEAMGIREAAFSAPERAYMQSALAGGFNRTWGLHLPETDATAMGSVLVYKNPGLTADDLRALEWRGIGARREEGFGRVAFNLHGDAGRLRKETDEDRKAQQGGLPAAHELQEDTESHGIATQMAERMLRRQLDLALGEAVTRRSVGGTQMPRSQIGGLRAVLQRALTLPENEKQNLGEGEDFEEDQALKRGRALIRTHLDDVESRPTARARFDGVFVYGEGEPTPLLEWIRERANDGTPRGGGEASLWDELGTRDAQPAVGTVEADLTDRLLYVYNLRLAHDVLAQAGKDA